MWGKGSRFSECEVPIESIEVPNDFRRQACAVCWNGRPSSPTEAMGGVQGVLALKAGQLLAVALKAKEEMEEARKRFPYTYGYPSRPSWAGGEAWPASSAKRPGGHAPH